MKVTFETFKLDENSTEMVDLILAGRNCGQYSFGTYSKLVRYWADEKNAAFGRMTSFAIKMLENEFHETVSCKEDIERLIDKVQGMTVGEWLEMKINDILTERGDQL